MMWCMKTQVYGVPGTSFDSAGWAANSGVAAVGAKYEREVGKILNEETSGVAVFHSLNLPIRNTPADVDHAVLCGSDLWLIDTKGWKRGFYWTAGGRTSRGFTPFKYADGTNMASAYTAYTKVLDGRVKVHEPLIVVPRATAFGLMFYRPRRGRAITLAQLQRLCRSEWSSTIPLDQFGISMIREQVRHPSRYRKAS